ncbi:MAG: N-acetylgalactosamine 6-sulfate sulfatase, partial [Planctomycetaceae bacterium]
EDFITWDIDVGQTGEYEAIVHYTCAEQDTGATLQLSMTGGAKTQAIIEQAFDPPLYDKSKERVSKSHYYVKDFKPLSLGVLLLKKGRGTLRLQALDIQGQRVVDIHSIDLLLK